jgi:uncharacterized protein (TIGR02246 family)
MRTLSAALLLTLAMATPSMAGDLKDDLIALEKAAWTAWGKKDGQAFREFVAEDAVQAVAGAGVTSGREKIIAAVNSHNCVATSFDFKDVKARQLTPDLAIVSYTANQDTTCDGRKLPTQVYSTNVYAKQGGKWRSISYQETAIE